MIGPFGVIAVETKWSATEWASPAGYKRIEVAAKQASDSARRITRLLQENGIDIEPSTLVVLWGGRARDWTADRRVRTVSDATVVPGVFISEWAVSFTSTTLSSSDCIAIERIIPSV